MKQCRTARGWSVLMPCMVAYRHRTRGDQLAPPPVWAVAGPYFDKWVAWRQRLQQMPRIINVEHAYVQSGNLQ